MRAATVNLSTDQWFGNELHIAVIYTSMVVAIKQLWSKSDFITLFAKTSKLRPPIVHSDIYKRSM